MVAEQLREIDVLANSILLEPVGRNTAPAIALAALKILETEDQVMLVLPADNVIPNVEALRVALDVAENAAGKGSIVTFGIFEYK
jgi:mannose-1-phosphate guanylyltransferase